MSSAAPGLRERKKQRTRLQIEMATYRLVVERGWAATTIAAIAEAAEVAPRTISAYFPTKLDIVFGENADFAPKLTEIYADPDVSIADGIKRWLEWQAPEVDRERAKLRLAAIQSDEELFVRDHASLVAWERAVAEAVSHRTGQPADWVGPRMVASCAATLWFSFREYLQRDSPPFAETWARAFDVLERVDQAVSDQADLEIGAVPNSVLEPSPARKV